ncbi:MAG TPA: FkbM family methyltransferase, partial [Gemmatimonadaceae bacterium]|nr:FkbM family methyltransferase [Gemmatimonadaceae bacterium]
PDEPIPDYVVIGEELSPDVLDVLTVLRVRNVVVRATRRLCGPQWAIAVAALLARNRYRAMIATGEDVGLRLAILSRLTGSRIRMVVVCHNITGRRSKLALKWLRAGDKVALFHCLTSSQAQILNARYGIPEERIRVVHWHVDHRFFRPSPARPAHARRICSAGTAARDYATLVDAARGLAAELKIAADSPWFLEALNVTSGRRGQEPEIRSVGSYDSLRDLYASSRFVVVPLLDVDRAAGLSVILEAMAMGKAVIATRTRAPDDLIIDGQNGFHVKPGDSAELRARMQFLLDHPDEADRMGSEGRRMVEERFTIESYIAQLRQDLDLLPENRSHRVNPLRRVVRAVRLYQIAGGRGTWLRVTGLLSRALFERRSELAVPVEGSVVIVGTGPRRRLLSSGELGELIFLAREIYQQRVYELVPDFAPGPGWTVVDVGANIGMFAVRAAQLGANVLAFEPNPQCSRWLAETIVANGFDDRVTLFACALGSQAGHAVLDIGAGSLGARLNPATLSGAVATVSIRRLDDVAVEIGLKRVDLLKLDVEGHEVEVLKGAGKTLELVDRVVLEYHSARLLRESEAVLRSCSLLPAGAEELHPELGYGHAFFKRASHTAKSAPFLVTTRRSSEGLTTSTSLRN